MKNWIVAGFILVATGSFAGEGKHLFILSGQSNMQRFDPNVSFTPAVESEFGKENVIVVKDALGGQPIRRWYKEWTDAVGQKPGSTGDLYDRLMSIVNPAIAGQKIETATFVWMQGERDARDENGSVYKKSLEGLVEQLSRDLGRDDINVVIGRISDFDLGNTKYSDWTKIRKAQVEFAEDYSRGAWINTDDCNSGLDRSGKMVTDDLHMSEEGYKLMGERYAEKAIELIKQHPHK